ncbi:MAG TPA: hypothetical protein VIE89_10030 [Candidatus Binatia bacterium]|jgi:hypothetical protein
MECQRCLTGKEAKYRVYSDIIDLKVCEACADAALQLGLAVEALDDDGKKNRLRKCEGTPRSGHVHL